MREKGSAKSFEKSKGKRKDLDPEHNFVISL